MIYIVGKVLTRATFWCIANFADVSGFCVMCFFYF